MIFFFSVLLSGQVTNYWNLGIGIKKEGPQKRIVQREIVLSNTNFYTQTQRTPQDIYTLQTNNLIAPEKKVQSFLEQKNTITIDSKTIKELIINEEYFEAAKQIITLEERKTEIEFENPDDYYYWSSFVYFNLGNQIKAKKNISQISNKNEDVKALFLESLIIRNEQEKASNSILRNIIKKFPNNDYSEYARSLLIDGR